MQVTTIDEASALVGRTFERKGETRRFEEVTGTPELTGINYTETSRHWDRFDAVSKWLSQATEVPNG